MNLPKAGKLESEVEQNDEIKSRYAYHTIRYCSCNRSHRFYF